MRMKYTAVLVAVVLAVCPVLATFPACAQESAQKTENMEDMMATVSINDADLNAEADKLGIPASEKKKYVVNMREINKEYQQGSMTRTEYVGVKRNLIQSLK